MVASRGERDATVKSVGVVRAIPVVDPQGKADGLFPGTEASKTRVRYPDQSGLKSVRESPG